ncbi:hypothetical protein KZ483_24185 [Paenibacillus sp. sptzw28]|uniref:hypothetical protein n=1 Tax=Paenibacillus sp. sptzw28 TaxID=715179 RepID=UPI001C6E96EB|nr:hypothetical protein [Paenibacillus sp. sptzw28]QYR20820.1 hypothetical protein KZ483_24185 [Paenibacillus sp. sptzw28]
MSLDLKRRFFQRIKSMSLEKFLMTMNVLHSRAYAKAQEHYGYAMDIVLTPKKKAEVEAKAHEIRETWDGMMTLTIDETEYAELKTAETGPNVSGSTKEG